MILNEGEFMQIILIILCILFLLYLIFIFGPAATSFFYICKTRECLPFWERKGIENTYYAPYIELFKAQSTKLEKRLTKTVTLTADDGAQLVGRYYSANSKNHAILLHGYNACPENNYAETANDLLDAGISVFMPCSRAHLPSSKGNCTFGLTEQYDLIRWIDYAVKEFGAERIVLYGVSMGCATIAFASDKINDPAVRAMVLDCGFETPLQVYETACKQRHMPVKAMSLNYLLLAKIFLKQDFTVSVKESLAKTSIPALFVHGTNDTTVDVGATKRNYAVCSSEKEMILSEGSSHSFSYTDLKAKGDNRILEYIKNHLCEEK